MPTKSLLQKTKEAAANLNYNSKSMKPQYQKTTKQHVDLALAIVKSEVPVSTALTTVFGTRGGAHYASVIKWLKLAYKEGRVIVK